MMNFEERMCWVCEKIIEPNSPNCSPIPPKKSLKDPPRSPILSLKGAKEEKQVDETVTLTMVRTQNRGLVEDVENLIFESPRIKLFL